MMRATVASAAAPAEPQDGAAPVLAVTNRDAVMAGMRKGSLRTRAGSPSRPILGRVTSPRAPRSPSGEGTLTDFVKELLPRIVAEAKDGTCLILAVTNGYTTCWEVGDFNAVPVRGAGAGLPPRQIRQICRSLSPAYRG
jgi:hypothetical protein